MRLEKRWVILEHIDDPSDPLGFHFDLLLEDCSDCRTWRLNSLPLVDGPALPAVSIPAHSLDWLNRQGGLVSRGRGWAYRLQSGLFRDSLPETQKDLLQLELFQNGQALVQLEISHRFCKFSSILWKSRNLH